MKFLLLPIISRFIVTFVIGMIASAASASVILGYTGNNYTNAGGPTYDTSMFVSGSVEIATSLGVNFSGSVTPLSFNFSDGVFSYTDTNSQSSFTFTTDNTGSIISWNIQLENPPKETLGVGEIGMLLGSSSSFSDGGTLLECLNVSSSSCNAFQIQEQANTLGGSPGNWTITTVPIPAAAWLFGSGLLGLIGMARRKSA